MGSLIVYLGIEKAVKILICAVAGTVFALGCTGCGVSSGNGFVAGTTGYLETYYQGTDRDRGAK